MPRGPVSARKAAAGALAASIAACGLRADTLLLHDGNSLTEVEVIAARWDGIQYRVRGQTTSLPGEQVAAVERDSRWLAPIRQEISSGRYQKGIESIDKVLKSLKDWEKAEAEFLRGQALLRAGDPRKAAQAFDAYLAANKEAKDWWVPHAVYALGQTALAQGQGKTAETQFKDLEGYGKAWVRRSRLGLGHALLTSGKPGEARPVFEQVVRDRESSLAMRQEAMVGKARALFVQKQYPQAIAELAEGFFKEAKGPEAAHSEARGQATLLVAQCHRALGKKEDLEQAEIWFLKTALFYRHYPEVYREAAKELAELYARLNRKERAEEWRRRGAPSNGPQAGEKPKS